MSDKINFKNVPVSGASCRKKTTKIIMNRLTLTDSDSACLSFNGQIKNKDYQINILAAENLPSVVIKQNGMIIVNETVKSIDDLKIFLEERLYKYLEG